MDAENVFIPRPDVQHILDETVRKSETGQAQAVWLFGETGQGKTSFIKDYLVSLDPRFITSYVGCSSPIGNQSTTLLKPYQPLKDVLEDLLTSHAHARRRLNLIKNISLTVLACIPVVGELAYGIKEIRRDWTEFKKGEREIDFQDFVEGYFETLLRLADEAPVIIVIDDIQWADKQTISALSYFFGEKKYLQQPMVFVFSGRYDELLLSADGIGLYASFSQSRISQDIHLKPFDASQIRDFYHARFPMHVPDPNLLLWLQQKTGGNPFFIQSYIQHLLIEGILSDDGVIAGDLYTYKGMPAEIQLVNSWLMKALSEEEQHLLLTSSTLGYEFSLHELSALMHAPGVELIRKLRRIKTNFGIVEPIGYKLINGRESTVYRFSQHAIHTALYNELTAEEREALHRETAQYLNQLRMTSSDDPEILNSLASALMLHARLGKQPEIEYESFLLKARNTPEELDDEAILRQLEMLAPSIGIPPEELERMYHRASRQAPFFTHLPKGEHAVQTEDEDVDPIDALAPLMVKLLQKLRRDRQNDAMVQIDAFISRQQMRGYQVHPLLFIMQALISSSRGEAIERILEQLEKASGDVLHPTYAAVADLGLAVFHPDADEEKILQALQRVSRYTGKHRSLLQRMIQTVLGYRFGASPAYAEMLARITAFPDSPDLRARIGAMFPETFSIISAAESPFLPVHPESAD